MQEIAIFQHEPIFRLSLPVTEEDAYDAVAEYLTEVTQGMEVVIHQKPAGEFWIYYYESAPYLRTQNPLYQLGAHAPLLLDTTTGEGFVTEEKEGIEESIAGYREFREQNRL